MQNIWENVRIFFLAISIVLICMSYTSTNPFLMMFMHLYISTLPFTSLYKTVHLWFYIHSIIFLQICTSPTNVLKGPLGCTPCSKESNCFFQIASVYICLADRQNLGQQLILITYHSAQLSDFTGEQHSSNMEINWFDVVCCFKRAGLQCKISWLYFDLIQISIHHFLSTLLFSNYKSIKPTILTPWHTSHDVSNLFKSKMVLRSELPRPPTHHPLLSLPEKCHWNLP